MLIIHGEARSPDEYSIPDISNQRWFAFWMLLRHLTCLLLQQAALGGPVTVALAISHLLQTGHIHRGEPWQRLQVPREVLFPQLGGVRGQKPLREKRDEGEVWAEVNTAVSSVTHKPYVEFKSKHLIEHLNLQSKNLCNKADWGSRWKLLVEAVY